MKRPFFAILATSFSLFAIYFFIPSFAVEGGETLEVTRITPGGDEISDLRQIVIEFSRPMVPLGDMKRDGKDIPVEISPKAECEWIWLNQTTLSCNLDEKHALANATRYTVDVKPGLVALDKARMMRSVQHAFTTKLPAIESAYVVEWKSPTHPKIRVVVNQPTTGAFVQNVLGVIRRDNGDVVSKVQVKEFIELDWQGKQVLSSLHRMWDVEPSSALAPAAQLALAAQPGFRSLAGPLANMTDQTAIEFDTFDAFRVVGIECWDGENDIIVKTYDSSTLCSPSTNVKIVFNAPVATEAVYKVLQIAPAVNLESKDGEYFYDDVGSELKANHLLSDLYRVTLPSLKPWQQYRVSLIKDSNGAVDLKDLFDRPLASLPTFTFATNHYSPHAWLNYRYAVLESDSASDVFVDVLNLDTFRLDYSGLTAQGELKKQSEQRTRSLPQDKTVSVPLEIRKLLRQKSGVIRGELYTSLSDTPDHFFVEVTPFQVHAKIGHFNSLVWVTDLATGRLISGAKVSLHVSTFDSLSTMPAALASANTDSNGVANLPGTSTFDPSLEAFSWDDDGKHLFVRVEKDGHLALLPAIYDFETSSYRASGGTVFSDAQVRDHHTVAWGTTAQGVHRLGDQVRYKIYVRDQNNEALKAPRRDGYSLKVSDPMGKVVHERMKVALSAFGALDGDFTAPRNGGVGYYDFVLTTPAGQDVHTMSVLVSDFTPAPFHVSQDVNAQAVEAGQATVLTTRALLHSGGAFAGAQTHITANIERDYFKSKTPATKGFDFASASDGEYNKAVFTGDVMLDRNGEAKNELVLPASNIYFGKLKLESSVQDERGKSISAFTSIDYSSVDRFVGLKNAEPLVRVGQPFLMQLLVIDAKQNVVAGESVSLVFEREENKMARIKDVGNTYTTHVTTQWVKQSGCAAISGPHATGCRFTPQHAGYHRVRATVKDTKGREHITESSVWVAGADYVVWDDKNENFLDIVPEKMNAVVGEKARFFLKNPYPGAQALITVERFGVIDRFVKTLKGSAEIIEIPVKANYGPGFYLSVTIQSPRVAKAPKTGLDLGKPTFSMGYIEVPVVDRYKEIIVTAKAAQEVYRPRDKVRVQLSAKPKVTGKAEKIELAVAVVDEAVFDLLQGGVQNYDAYRGLNTFASLDLKNFSLLTRLVTRQAVETKGANPGGGGGAGVDIPARSDFKLLSYWNPSVMTDANGNAVVEFEAPDTLTGWRVIAMAVTANDKAGHGMSSFKVNRPTEIRSAMPNQCVEGDSLTASFSVMNRSDKPRDLRVSIKATGDVEGASDYSTVVKLAAFERKSVTMPIRAKTLAMNRDLLQGAIRFVVRAGDDVDSDALEHTLPVQKQSSFETSVVYGSLAEEMASIDLLIPHNIFTDVGSIDVNVSPTVVTSVEGAFRYMRDYPYTCWEQRLTKALMAHNYQRLKDYVPTFKWAGSETIAQSTLDSAGDFQSASGGMAYFVPSDTWADPYLSAYTALSFQWLRKAGKKVPELVEGRLHNYLLDLLKRDTTPAGYSEASMASVRATALFALAQAGKVTLADVKRFEPHFDRMGLFGQTHFVQAALQFVGGEQLARDRVTAMMGKTTQSSGKFLFSDSSSAEFARILSSEVRNNCAALDMLVTFAKKEGLDKVGDLPMKLMRSINQARKSRDYYENTQENLFCMQAIANYAQVYEATTPNMRVAVKLNAQTFGETSFASKTARPVTLSKPIQAGDEGRTAKINLERSGEGRLYYAASLSTSSKDAGKKAINAGISLKRHYSVWREKKWNPVTSPVAVKRGDVVKVELTVSLARTGNFVVVNDPIPGALEPINSDLATASSLGSVTAEGFYHTELLHNVARFYSDYLNAGTYTLSYTAQVVGEGRFTAMPPLAEEMYDPDVHGKDVTTVFEVK